MEFTRYEYKGKIHIRKQKGLSDAESQNKRVKGYIDSV